MPKGSAASLWNSEAPLVTPLWPRPQSRTGSVPQQERRKTEVGGAEPGVLLAQPRLATARSPTHSQLRVTRHVLERSV